MILIVCLVVYFLADIAITLLKLILKVISLRSSIGIIPILNAPNDKKDLLIWIVCFYVHMISFFWVVRL